MIKCSFSGQAAGDGYVQFDKESDMKDALNRHMEKIGHRFVVPLLSL